LLPKPGKYFPAALAVGALPLFCGCEPPQDAPVAIKIHEEYGHLEGEFLGQDRPGLIPELFAPFIVASRHHKHSSPAFSHDGNEVYFSIYLDYEYPQQIYYMRRVGERWSAPQPARFASPYQEGGPRFSADGQKLFYYSKRPKAGMSEAREDSEIWYVERTPEGWSAPRNPGAPLNTDRSDYPGSLATDGSFVFFREMLNGTYGISHSKFHDGTFSDPQDLGHPVNTTNSYDSDPVIAPDGSYMIFCSFRRTGDNDLGLWIRFRQSDGSWSAVKGMGDMINGGRSRFPSLSPDGTLLFFTSYRSGEEQFYWVDASVIEFLRNDNLDLQQRFTQSIVEEGSDGARQQLVELEAKYGTRYQFNESFLGGVGAQLIHSDELAAAAKILRLNLELYPEVLPVLRRIELAVVEADEETFEELANRIAATVPHRPGIEVELNRFGYDLLAAGSIDRAVQILALNAELFQESPNAHDSLGEAYVGRGDRELARSSYNRVLELSPGDANATTMLEQLTEP
jgi:hypothetical protein